MRSSILVPLALCLASCAPGPLEVTAYGEAFAEEEIPADVFVDGWTADLSRFELRIEGLGLYAGEEALAFDPDVHVVDVAKATGGAGQVLATLSPGAAYERLELRVAPADGTPSVVVEGEATKGEVTKRFSWSFETTTTYACAPLAAADPAVGQAQITVHVDHMFYDDLDSEEPNVAFDLIAAADTDDDGEVTQAELEATDITSEERYQVGSRDIDDLWGFLEAQTRTLGHIDGEGHCETR